MCLHIHVGLLAVTKQLSKLEYIVFKRFIEMVLAVAYQSKFYMLITG